VGQGARRRGRGHSASVLIPPRLQGNLALPAAARGLVLFAHGSGSSRLSPRNAYVAEALQAAGIGTLLFDLLTEAEAADRAKVFDVDLLAGRLLGASAWVAERAELRGLPLGYFGASTGAAAALSAAAIPGSGVAAVVCRGGRPDLAGSSLPHVRAAVLLIVGGEDGEVRALNRQAQARLRCENCLEVVPGATHLFEEPGCLAQVVALACCWFSEHFGSPRVPHALR
jgi:putative phosphoribosyl transferase